MYAKSVPCFGVTTKSAARTQVDTPEISNNKPSLESRVSLREESCRLS